MNLITKTLIVLAPGGLMGAGIGALIGSLGLDPSSPAVLPVQTLGVILWLCAIGLRVLLSEAELRLTRFAGLISNGVCTFLSGGAIILMLRMLGGQPAQAGTLEILAVVALGWIPCVALTLVGLALTAPLRAKSAIAARED